MKTVTQFMDTNTISTAVNTVESYTIVPSYLLHSGKRAIPLVVVLLLLLNAEVESASKAWKAEKKPNNGRR